MEAEVQDLLETRPDPALEFELRPKTAALPPQEAPADGQTPIAAKTLVPSKVPVPLKAPAALQGTLAAEVLATPRGSVSASLLRWHHRSWFQSGLIGHAIPQAAARRI